MSEDILTINDDLSAINAENEHVDYSEKSLQEILDIFSGMLENEDHHELYKNAEALKSAFYKNLNKFRSAAMPESGDGESVSEDTGTEDRQQERAYADEECRFKELYAAYKADRAEFNARNEKIKEENLAKKIEIINEIKALIEKGDVSQSFPDFRALQQRWRETGPIPASSHKDVYETYQHTVEMFYDLVSIDRELRDLDFKKNLEIKTKFCEMAEKLADNKNVIEAFRTLQKLHEQWKEFGPVAKEYRDSIWERFKAATSVINKRYQEYFETQKEKFKANLAAKTEICEKVEQMLTEEIKSAKDWLKYTEELESFRKAWREIGPVGKKYGQKIYERFRAASDKFYEKRKAYYDNFKSTMHENLMKKTAICEQAEALQDSEDWKATTEAFVDLQKQWKEIGPVPRKKAEPLWNRFRKACDTFFDNRNKNSNDPSITIYLNLRSKKALVKEIKAYVPSGDEQQDRQAMDAFVEKWNGIGYVPIKEKDKINKAYFEALDEKFPFASKESKRGAKQQRHAPVSEKERLIQLYNRKEAELATYENNMGFFSQSSGSLIEHLKQQIEAAKAELARIEEQIKELENKENSEA